MAFIKTPWRPSHSVEAGVLIFCGKIDDEGSQVWLLDCKFAAPIAVFETVEVVKTVEIVEVAEISNRFDKPTAELEPAPQERVCNLTS